MLTRLCTYRGCVPQGAPTSPFISNIVLREFDTIEARKYIKNQLKDEGFYVNDKKTIVLRDGQRKQVTGIVVNKKLSIPAVYKKKYGKKCIILGCMVYLIILREYRRDYRRKNILAIFSDELIMCCL